MRLLPHVALILVVFGALIVTFGYSPGPADSGDPAIVDVAAPPYPEILATRPMAKRLVALDVAAGRCSLLQAAAQFAALNRLPPEQVTPTDFVPLLPIPVRTAAERLCGEVLFYVRLALIHDPEALAAAERELEAEFQEQLRTRGVIRLPDPSSLEPVENLLARARQRLAAVRRSWQAADRALH